MNAFFPSFLRRSPLALAQRMLIFLAPLLPMTPLLAQAPAIDPSRITIARDAYGIPHIHAPTDPEAAYGLAYATAEDDFESMQYNVLAIRGRLAEVLGKEGAIGDVVAFLIDVDGQVESRYDTHLSADYKAILEAYAAGVNAYAAAHPDEVLLKNVFPIGPKDLEKGYALGVTMLTGLDVELLKVFNGSIANFEYQLKDKGSNAMAFNAKRMADGRTHLILNSHQPLSGPTAWYEAHIVSDEGWNMMGGTFPGGATIFVGTNEHLGWGHTLNYPDYVDVYKLTMHPKDKLSYLFDGEYRELEERTIKLRVKVAGVKLPVKRTFYRSIHGPVIKNKTGYYALRYPASFGIGAGEQWYRMNKASNFDEFEAALKTSKLPGINVVYADDQDNIYYLANGHFAKRAAGYDWKAVLPGDTSVVVWDPVFAPVDSLPVYLNPDCGYVFNTNNSPFFATCEEENLKAEDYDSRRGYELYNNNRAWRFHEQMEAHQGLLSLDDIKRMKYDRNWGRPARTSVISNLERIFELDEKQYPEIADALVMLRGWDRTTEPDNTNGAALWVMCIHHAVQHLMEGGRLIFPNEITDEEFIDVVTKARKHMYKHFGRLDVPLGELQRHVRGETDYPVGGTADVLAAMSTEPWKKGRMSSDVGDGYVAFVSYGDGLPKIEAVNCYGASNKPDSPHFDDQIDLYLNQQLRIMTLDWEEVLRTATRSYHPGQE
jgi:acyl-homoserine-lactone acylase